MIIRIIAATMLLLVTSVGLCITAQTVAAEPADSLTSERPRFPTTPT